MVRSGQAPIRIWSGTLAVVVTSATAVGFTWMALFAGLGDLLFSEAQFAPAAWFSGLGCVLLVAWLAQRTRVIVSPTEVVVVNPLSTRRADLAEMWTADWEDSLAYSVWRFRGSRLVMRSAGGQAMPISVTTGVADGDPRLATLVEQLEKVGVDVQAR